MYIVNKFDNKIKFKIFPNIFVLIIIYNRDKILKYIVIIIKNKFLLLIKKRNKSI